MRVPPITDDVASHQQRQLLAEVGATRGVVYNLYRAMAHSPEAASRVAALGSYLRYGSVLPPRLRELVMLAMSGRWEAGYIGFQHEPIARSLGVSDEAVRALALGEAPVGLEPLEAMAVGYVLALARDGRADASAVDELRRALGNDGLVELHLLAGYYTMLALFLNGLDVEPEAPASGSTSAPSG